MNLGTQKVKREVSLLLCHRSLHPNPTHLTLCPILFSCKCMFLFIYVACPCVDIISVVLLCRDTGTWCYIYWYEVASIIDISLAHDQLGLTNTLTKVRDGETTLR